MTTDIASRTDRGFSSLQYAICLNGIVWREGLRFLHQRERFVSALVRPLVWLFIFAAGFRQVLGVSIIPPYDTYVLYEVYITPGLIAMIQLFNGMQSSLSMVYDREMGNMRTLLVSPLPRWFLLSSKLVAGTAVSLLQVYAFLLIAWFWDIEPPPIGYLTVLPALVLTGLMLGALGMLISSVDQAAREFRRGDELRHFPDVFCVVRALPVVARAGRERRCSTTSVSSIRSPTRPSSFALPSMAKSTGYRWRSCAAAPRCSWSAPSWPMIPRGACWRGAATAEARNEARGSTRVAPVDDRSGRHGAGGRSALPGLALQSDQGAGAVGGGGLGRPADR